MDLHDDSGQSTIEWLALMAMMVALAGALFAVIPGLGDTIVGAVEKLIRGIAG